jgi:hypothetical protein
MVENSATDAAAHPGPGKQSLTVDGYAVSPAVVLPGDPARGRFTPPLDDRDGSRFLFSDLSGNDQPAREEIARCGHPERAGEFPEHMGGGL